MTVGSLTHIILLICTAGFITLACVVIRKIPKIWQTVMIWLAVFVCCAFIFYRYAMGLSFERGVNLEPLLMQQLQVCNFNFILLPLALVPKFNIPRQYAFYFSMFAASTTLFAFDPNWGNMPWYAPTVLNSWIYHSFAILSPLLMWSAGWIKPDRKYIPAVSGCVFGYFTLAYIICEILKGAGIMAPEQSFSFIYDTTGIPILDTFHTWIPVPYWHLYLAFPILLAFFYGLSMFFNRKITFDLAGGVGRLRRKYGAIGGELQLPHGGGLREGYYLAGWKRVDGSNVEYALGEKIIMEKHNFTLQAIWEPIGMRDEALPPDEEPEYVYTIK